MKILLRSFICGLLALCCCCSAEMPQLGGFSVGYAPLYPWGTDGLRVRMNSLNVSNESLCKIDFDYQECSQYNGTLNQYNCIVSNWAYADKQMALNGGNRLIISIAEGGHTRTNALTYSNALVQILARYCGTNAWTNAAIVATVASNLFGVVAYMEPDVGNPTELSGVTNFVKAADAAIKRSALSNKVNLLGISLSNSQFYPDLLTNNSFFASVTNLYTLGDAHDAWAGRGNGVCPGFTNTPAVDPFLSPDPLSGYVSLPQRLDDHQNFWGTNHFALTEVEFDQDQPLYALEIALIAAWKNIPIVVLGFNDPTNNCSWSHLAADGSNLASTASVTFTNALTWLRHTRFIGLDIGGDLTTVSFIGKNTTKRLYQFVWARPGKTVTNTFAYPVAAYTLDGQTASKTVFTQTPTVIVPGRLYNAYPVGDPR